MERPQPITLKYGNAALRNVIISRQSEGCQAQHIEVTSPRSLPAACLRDERPAMLLMPRWLSPCRHVSRDVETVNAAKIERHAHIVTQRRAAFYGF